MLESGSWPKCDKAGKAAKSARDFVRGVRGPFSDLSLGAEDEGKRVGSDCGLWGLSVCRLSVRSDGAMQREQSEPGISDSHSFVKRYSLMDTRRKSFMCCHLVYVESRRR